MTRTEFEELIRHAIKSLPQKFRDKLENVDVVIDEETRNSLLGLYQGIPLKDRTTGYNLVMPDKITLFKRNIEGLCEATGRDIQKEVKHVIVHEIAHHFGMSDQHLRDLGVY